MGHHAEAAKTLRSLGTLQQQHGIDTSPTAHRLQEADLNAGNPSYECLPGIGTVKGLQSS